MDEAEKLCDHIAIMDRGQIIALDTPKNLMKQIGGEHIVELELSETPPDSLQLDHLPSVLSTKRNRDGLVLTVGEPHVAIPALLSYLADQGIELTHLNTRHCNLEDVFIHLTGRRLSDE